MHKQLSQRGSMSKDARMRMLEEEGGEEENEEGGFKGEEMVLEDS